MTRNLRKTIACAFCISRHRNLWAICFNDVRLSQIAPLLLWHFFVLAPRNLSAHAGQGSQATDLSMELMHEGPFLSDVALVDVCDSSWAVDNARRCRPCVDQLDGTWVDVRQPLHQQNRKLVAGLQSVFFADEDSDEGETREHDGSEAEKHFCRMFSYICTGNNDFRAIRQEVCNLEASSLTQWLLCVRVGNSAHRLMCPWRSASRSAM